MSLLRLVFFILSGCLAISCGVNPIILDSGPLRVPRTQASYHWDSSVFPIPVVLHPEMEEARLAGTLAALDYWNWIVGVEVFTPVLGDEDFPMFYGNGSFNYRGHISVEESALGRNEVGQQLNGVSYVALFTRLRGSLGEIHSCRIELGTHVLLFTDVVPIMFHEFGHCLGLAHDVYDTNSIMYPSATLNPFQELQREDLAYVRSQLGS